MQVLYEPIVLVGWYQSALCSTMLICAGRRRRSGGRPLRWTSGGRLLTVNSLRQSEARHCDKRSDTVAQLMSREMLLLIEATKAMLDEESVTESGGL